MALTTLPGHRPPAPMLSSCRQCRRLLPHLWGPGRRGLRKAAKASLEADPEPAAPTSPLARSEPILFPELLAPGKRAFLLGVDPDINGAVAVLSWRNSSGRADSSSGDAGSNSSSSSSRQAELGELTVSVHDMPVELWQLGSRSKKQPEPAALLEMLRQHAGLGSGGQEAGGDAEVVVRAVLEHTTPQHICGKYAWYGMGYSFGLLTGVLTSQGIPHHRVDASVWKRGLGLFRTGKEGSLALARQLFPQAEQALRRKMDHGRAEAMLIAAWGLGMRAAVGKEAPGSKRGGRGAAGKAESSAAVEEEQPGSSEPASAPPKARRSRKTAAAAAGKSASSSDGGGSSSSSGGTEAVDGAPVKRRTRKKAADTDSALAV